MGRVGLVAVFAPAGRAVSRYLRTSLSKYANSAGPIAAFSEPTAAETRAMPARTVPAAGMGGRAEPRWASIPLDLRSRTQSRAVCFRSTAWASLSPSLF